MRITIVATLVACCISSSVAFAQNANAERIRRDIATLADDRWEGRQTCTPGIDSAAAYIAQRFASLRLMRSGSHTDFYHRYVARSAVNAHNGGTGCDARNVVGIIAGSDPALANEFVVIGAHYDHLGRSTVGAQDPNSTDPIRNGADDNASGTAGVMELARLFSSQPTRRSLIFVTFSGEELGLLGSEKFANEALPSGRVQAMINFDMIGRLRDDKLLVYGVGTSPEMRSIVEKANATTPFKLSLIPDGYGPSDHTSFYSRKIPVLHFFTDVHEDYHKASDEASKINAPGTARVVDYAARVIRDIADRSGPLAHIDIPRTVVATPSSGGARPYLGSVPDMGGGDVAGLRISAVTAGSPGDKGGMRAGDVVVELAGKPVTDLTTYSEALYAHKSGDTIEVVVKRAGARVTLKVTLATRGS